MPDFVEVAVNIPQVTDVFHYHMPEELAKLVRLGSLVEVPFGNQQVQAVVLRMIDTPSVQQTRPITAIIDSEAVLSNYQIMLAKSLAEESLITLPAWVSLMLPPGLGQLADTLYDLNQNWRSMIGAQQPTKLQTRIIKALSERGALRGRQLDQALPRVNWRASIRTLLRKQVITATPVLPAPSVRPKLVRMVEISSLIEKTPLDTLQLGKPGSQATLRRQAILEFLSKEAQPTQVSWVYASSGGNSSDLRKLADMGLIRFSDEETWRDPLSDFSFVPATSPTLIHEQQKIWDEISNEISKTLQGAPVNPILLHGVTGSGKTEMYLLAVESVLSRNRQAIILVPEIALTAQTVQRFIKRFQGHVGIIHSRLSLGERYDTWRRARSGDISIIIGPRSAIFTPFPNPGLIIMDECHDDSYYQSEPPFYHTHQIAETYTRLTNGVLIMGSATPNITSIYQANQGKYKYLELPRRILAHREAVLTQSKRWEILPKYQQLEGDTLTIELPPVSIIDMRQELQAGNRSIFSRALQNALGIILDQDQQVILFLNRRGTATYVFCRDCGYTLKCPNCDIPLTYHTGHESSVRPNQDDSSLVCHRCGYRRKMPATCPQCGSARVKHYGIGTERVEAEVQALFPNARTIRWDFETTRQKGAHDAILKKFSSHQADIMIGTQMLAKGLDLPLVTLVGVVLADVGLTFPDYRTSERTFQLLTQVAGRAGRSPLGGQVILQTFQPDNFVIQAAARHDFKSFYDQELKFRRESGYPPFFELIRLEYRHRDAKHAEQIAHKMFKDIESWIVREKRGNIELSAPLPGFFARSGGFYRWQIILRGSNLVPFLRSRSFGDWRVEHNPPSLL